MQRTLLCCLVAVTIVSAKGQQWSTSIANRACYSIAVNPLNRSIVYVGNVARTFLRSADGGITWEELSIGSGGPGGASLITTLVVHPRDTAVLLAGGTSFAGLDRSDDGGQTWQNVLIDQSGLRLEIASSASIAFNATYPDSMFVMRHNPAYLYRSADAGITWDSVGAITGLPSQGRIRALSIAPDSSNILLAGGRSAYVQRSTDQGKTWAMATNTLSLSDAEIANFVWSPTTPGKVYAVAIIQNTSSGGLHESTDWGLTWTTTRFRDTSLYALAVQATKNGDEIFVGGNLLELYDGTLKGDSVVYRTVNSGTNWQSLDSVDWVENETGNIVANVYGFGIGLTGTYPEILMATEAGLYRSSYITAVADDLPPRQTQPPTIVVADNELIMPAWQGAQGAFSVEVTSVAGSGLVSIACVAGQQRVLLPRTAAGCYVVRAIGANETISTLVMLGY